MPDTNILNGKKVLIVDDEPDIVDTIEELLENCETKSSSSFESAKQLLETNPFDIAVVDIMGVSGYDLLAIAHQKGITTVMLTGHALSPEHFAKSMDKGASAYLPKDKLSEIAEFLADILEYGDDTCGLLGGWFDRLNEFYARKFGPQWLDPYEGKWR